DILVVDTTEVGLGGPTRVAIKNAFGLGALTPGDGIKVVDVLEPGNSAPEAFVLDGRAAAGAFEYFLFQGGRSDPDDGDWYLREGALRPEIPAYLGNADASIGMFVHTLHERLGEPQFSEDAHPSSGTFNSFWLRTIGRWSDSDPHGGGYPFDASTNT